MQRERMKIMLMSSFLSKTTKQCWQVNIDIVIDTVIEIVKEHFVCLFFLIQEKTLILRIRVLKLDKWRLPASGNLY